MLYGNLPNARRFSDAKPNRFLAALPATDFALLAPYLRIVPLERGIVLPDAGGEIDHVYFPHSGMVSVVAVMRGGAVVETMTVGRGGMVGATVGLGSRSAIGRAVVQLPGSAARLPSAQFRSAAKASEALRSLIVRYNDLLLAQIQQSVACNALHALEARLCRWLLQSHDCMDGDTIPLTQELLGQMLGVRRTSVTLTARLLQSAGMIRYSRGLVQIVDRRALEEAACECYAVVRHNIDKIFPPSPPHLSFPPRGDWITAS
jgi:CRP-like cAMP-binding protein